MPPKPAGKDKVKKKLTGRPAWISEELFELMHDVPRLVSMMQGVKGAKGDKKAAAAPKPAAPKPPPAKAAVAKDGKPVPAAPAAVVETPPITLTTAEVRRA